MVPMPIAATRCQTVPHRLTIYATPARFPVPPTMRPDVPRLGGRHFPVRWTEQRLQADDGCQRRLHVASGVCAPASLVLHGVPSNRVTCRLHRFQNVRMLGRLVAHHKKRRLRLVLGKDVQHPRGDRRVRPVVEGQMHRIRPLNRPHRARPNGPAKPLQQRRNTASHIQ